MRTADLEVIVDNNERREITALLCDLDSGHEMLLTEMGVVKDFDGEVLEIARDSMKKGVSRHISHRNKSYFVHVFVPPLRLIIVGAVHIAQALAHIGRTLGYEVTIVDPRRAFATEERFPLETLIVAWPHDAIGPLRPDIRTAIVTLTHDPKIDDVALIAALKTSAFYIGSLGSRRTHEKRLGRLRTAGLLDDDLVRINAPVGLDVGAITPAEIAVSVAAEITERLRLVSNS